MKIASAIFIFPAGNTPYNRPKTIPSEDYSNVKSCTQPEQVLPLRRILEGLQNGTILLHNHEQEFDIPEHEIDIAPGASPEATNAAIAAATSADLAQSAAQAGEIITAAPGFQIEDVQEFTDALEAQLSKASAFGLSAAAF